ncbi:CLUMA_CG008536, isoform A [Clunio marinus]|uniref:CLUMA_CG008536, isoform A n=1 Tax=Clunio marinus TaxID=568069 RepID=A0A1J1I435_9DIPT|nr:CLUMA_CG008536, isoform A [Clunio marinus]
MQNTFSICFQQHILIEHYQSHSVMLFIKLNYKSANFISQLQINLISSSKKGVEIWSRLKEHEIDDLNKTLLRLHLPSTHLYLMLPMDETLIDIHEHVTTQKPHTILFRNRR